MKKFFFLMLTAVAAVALVVSCKPENNNNNDKPGKVYRVKTYHDAWSGDFTYNYGADGKVATINRIEGEWVTEYTFNYKEGNVLEVLENGELKWTIPLNDKGYATSFDGKKFTYDAKGHMIKVEKDGNVISEATWDEKGNLTKWTRPEGDMFKSKNHTYGADRNVGKIHNIFIEDSGIYRWLAEIGLAGEATEYLCTGNVWSFPEDATKSTYEYEANDDGYVTKETKVYGGDNEIGTYTWEEVK